MNNLVTREHDKFSEKTTTRSMELQVDTGVQFSYFYIKLRHISTPNVDSMVIDITYFGPEWLFIRSGNLVLNINGVENITLNPHDQGTEAGGGIVEESAYYNITAEQLLTLSNAKTIEYKLSGSRAYVTGTLNENMQLICKSMYNAIYDQSTFSTELTNYEQQNYEPAPVVYNKPWYKKLWGQWLLGAIAYALMHFLVGWP